MIWVNWKHLISSLFWRIANTTVSKWPWYTFLLFPHQKPIRFIYFSVPLKENCLRSLIISLLLLHVMHIVMMIKFDIFIITDKSCYFSLMHFEFISLIISKPAVERIDHNYFWLMNFSLYTAIWTSLPDRWQKTRGWQVQNQSNVKATTAASYQVTEHGWRAYKTAVTYWIHSHRVIWYASSNLLLHYMHNMSRYEALMNIFFLRRNRHAECVYWI